METLSLAPIAHLTAPTALEVVAFNAGSDGCVYVVFAQPPLHYREQKGPNAGFAITRPKNPPAYRVFGLRGESVELDIAITGEPFNVHHVQPLGELLLLVCSRCHFRGGGDHERNGRLYSRTGVFVRDVLLGDGIEDVQTTPNGTIWTSYFDEGVFGNFGWDKPLGMSGLVAWSGSGEKMLEYEPKDGLDYICDCYALNVPGDDEQWLCYYTEFPLVRLRSGRVDRHWRSPVSGSDAFAVGHGHCLFRGGYKERDTYVLCELGGTDTPRIVKRFTLIDEEGNPLSPARVCARGDSIYLLAGTRIYQLDIPVSFTAS